MQSPPSNRQQRRQLAKQARKQGAAPLGRDQQTLMQRAVALQQAGRLAEARPLYEQLLAAVPEQPDALHMLGVLQAQLGDNRQALALVNRAIRQRPNQAAYYCNLGRIQRSLGEDREAMASFRKAIAVDGSFAPAYNYLGNALADQGEAEQAIALFNQAIAADPTHVSALVNLGIALKGLGRLDAAVEAYERAIAVNPDYAEAHSNLGVALRQQGKTLAAIAAHERALAINPNLVRSQWGALLSVPMIYDSEAELEAHRARWIAGVKQLSATVRLETPEQIADALRAITSGTNFNLHGQGKNDLEPQKLYGGLQQRIAGAAYPEFARPLARRKLPPGARLKVGFVSSFFYWHSIYKIHGRWITQLDRERFETHSFYLGHLQDDAVADIRANSSHFYEGFATERALIEAIRSQDLDVIIYTDIGMDPHLQSLTALRLAPVQCNAGCHPITSGLATIDYFLTSDLMEPPGGEAHYSEQVVRLPNLLSSYPYPPLERTEPARLVDAAPFAGTTYLNLQSLWKLLPQHDWIYPAIARQLPQSRFWFIGGQSADVNGRFTARLHRAFATAGLDGAAYCTLQPHQTQLGFFDLVQKADVILDSIIWSGNNTAMEATACEKPIVTVPGPWMRSNHTVAILRFLGVTDTIGEDLEDYIRIAARLGLDPDWRQSLVARIAARKRLIFYDDAPIRALETFMLGLF